MKKMQDETKLITVNGQQAYLDSEALSREKLRAMARTIGCEAEFMQMYSKWATAVSRCGNPIERRAMQEMGILEMSQLLDGTTGVGINGVITVNGKTVAETAPLPATTEKKDEKDVGR
jgi:hypothetical protein